jgi:hypothetical protein
MSYVKKANKINEFEAVMYRPESGGYIPHIKVKAPYWVRGSQAEVEAKYPNEMKALREFGINSSGRELYNTCNPRVVALESEAKVLFNQYKAIVTYLQLVNIINSK